MSSVPSRNFCDSTRPDPVRKCHHVYRFPGLATDFFRHAAAGSRKVAWARAPEPACVSDDLRRWLTADAGALPLRTRPSLIKGPGSRCSASPVLSTFSLLFFSSSFSFSAVDEKLEDESNEVRSGRRSNVYPNIPSSKHLYGAICSASFPYSFSINELEKARRAASFVSPTI